MQTLRVLLVEDNEVLRRIQVLMISSYGHEVIAAEGCKKDGFIKSARL